MSIENFDEDWKINWANKTIECKTPSHQKKYTVTDFWKWIRKMEASPTAGLSYEHIIDTDGMGSSYNMPRKVKLVHGYTIKPSSLKYLIGTDSVLLDQNNNILVKDNLQILKWWENSDFQMFMVFLAVLGIILAIFN